MVEPSGEKCGKLSSPRAVVSRCAVPPDFGITQMSPPYTNAMCVAETVGNRSMRASTCACEIDGSARVAAKRAMRIGFIEWLDSSVDGLGCQNGLTRKTAEWNCG